MSILLTVHNTHDWNTLVDASGLPRIHHAADPGEGTHILPPAQNLTALSALALQLPAGQQLWLAVVQAEYFLADAMINGSSLNEAAQTWAEQTTALLNLQRQQRQKLKLFNLHQALAQPAAFCALVGAEAAFNNIAPHSANNNLTLLIACQYLQQDQELQALNTRLQASLLPLCESENLSLDLDHLLQQNRADAAALTVAKAERDLIFSQLQQAQEQLKAHHLTATAQLAEAQTKAQQLQTAQQEILSTLTATSEERDLIFSQLQQVQEQLEAHHLTTAAQLAAANAECSKLQQTAQELKGQLTTAAKECKHTQQQLEKAKAESQKLQQTNRQLEAKLTATSEERDLILAQLQQVQEQLEHYYLSLQSEQQNNKHTLLARDKQQAKEIAKMESELRKTKARAASAEFAGQLLQQELNTLKASISWKAATPVRMLGRLVKKSDPVHDKLLQEIGLLLTSEYFDVDWYLRTYTDVAASQMNPAEHYLLFGAAEGRLPGPLFDGNWYLQHYPDVAAASINPLLHFVMYGQQEGRTSSPKLLTNNQNAEE